MIRIALVIATSLWSLAPEALSQVDAGSPLPSREAVEEKVDELVEAVGSSEQVRRRKQVYAGLDYSPLDLVVPSKKGGTLGLLAEGDTSYELEYLKGEIKVPFVIKDLGTVSERRISFLVRSFLGNSFNVFYGLAHNKTVIEIGSEDLNAWTGGYYPHLNLIEIVTMGATVGIGNRWTFENGFSLGCDWLGWSQPLYIEKNSSPVRDYIRDKDDKDRVDTVTKTAARLPRFFGLKLQAGWMF